MKGVKRKKIIISKEGNIMKFIRVKKLVFALSFFAFFFCFSVSILAASEVDLPKNMLWGSYDVGATAYIHASGMADALLKKYGIRVRILPSETSIGRTMLLRTGKVQALWTSSGIYHACQGIYDYASYQWGPQDLRLFLTHPIGCGGTVTKKSGIQKAEDLKGKRCAWIVGSSPHIVAMTGVLAFGNLTWDDVVKVEFPGFGATFKGLMTGKVDCVWGGANNALAYELASHPRGINWIRMPAEDKAGWARFNKHRPNIHPHTEIIGPGLSEENSVEICGSNYPLCAVYASADPDFVYNLVKALDLTYPLYKDVNPTAPGWRFDRVTLPPGMEAPFHEGAIRYFKEKGRWTAEMQEWNDKYIERIKKLQKAFKKASSEALDKKISGKNYKEFWMKERAKVLGE